VRFYCGRPINNNFEYDCQRQCRSLLKDSEAKLQLAELLNVIADVKSNLADIKNESLNKNQQIQELEEKSKRP